MIAKSGAKPALAQAVAELADAIAHLQSMAAGNVDLMPLDLSYASIDRLEALFRLMLQGEAGEPASPASDRRLAWYLGETLRSHAGASWAPDKEGVPTVRGLPLLPASYRFEPGKLVADFRRHRRPGALRRGVEPLDIPHMRTRLAEFVSEMPAALRALAADPWVRGAEVGKLDPKAASYEAVDGLQRALSRARERGASVEELCTLRQRIARYLGETLRLATGRDWSVSEDPKAATFGMFQVGSWCPEQLVGNLTATRPPDYFRRALNSLSGRR